MNLSRFTGLAVVLLALNAVLPAFFHDLWNPDEPRVSYMAQTMLETGDWVVPRIGTEPLVEQPPLQAWLIALSMAVFGSGFDRDWVPRIPSMLFCLATLWLVYRAGKRYWGRGVGLLAAIFLGTTVEFYVAYQRAVVDTSLAFSVTVGMVVLLGLFREPDRPISWTAALLLGLAAGASFLSKNLIGVVFLGLVFVALVVTYRRPVLLGANLLRLASSGVIAVLVALPWLIALGFEDPNRLEELLVDNTWGRFVRKGVHNPPPWEFFHRMLSVLLPWLIPALVVFVRAVKGLGRRDKSDRDGLSEGLLWWCALPCLLVLCSGSKREIYLLPVTPAVALAAAVWVESRLDSAALANTARVLIGILGVAAPVVALVGGIASPGLPWPVWIYVFLHLAVLYRYLRMGRLRCAEIRIPVCLMLLLTNVGVAALVIYPARNQRESYVPLCRELARYQGAGFEINHLDLPLRDRSAIPYYLEAPLRNVSTADEIRALFRPGASPAVLVYRASIEDRLPVGTEFAEVGEYRVRRRIRFVTNRRLGEGE